MNPFKTIHLIAVLCLLLTACVFNMTYKNREADKQEAMQVINKLFLDVANKNYAAADSLFSKDFFKVTPKEKLNGIFTLTQDNLGDAKDTELSQWETKVVKGTDASGNYLFAYNVKYPYYDAKVLVRLQKEPDGNIRIVAYRIESEGLNDVK